MAGEFLMVTLGEYGLFPEVRGQGAAGLGDSIREALAKLTGWQHNP
jgi:hypothetical protein